MQSDGRRPDRFVFPVLLRSAAHLPDSRNGIALHSFAIRFCLSGDAFIGSALIDFYAKRGRIEDARQVFDETIERDLVVWNSMMSGYVHRGLMEEGAALLEKMQCCGPNPDLTSLISGSVRNFDYEKAFATFRQMVAISGVRPSSATISSLLPASANVMDLRGGREIHGYAVVIGVEQDLFVSSSLVDMYGKCGVISDAEKVFDEMPLRNIVSWNSMIFAYANHGHCEKAIQLFRQMEISDVNPDHLTFTAVLTACSHGGMVEFGKDLFRLMQEDHNFKPRLEHYACMVDLLGRTGNLSIAHDMIKGMPMEPDSFVWGALLGACRNHCNVELAEIAAERLRELEPRSAGSCSLLSYVMSNAGRWGDAANIKKMVKKRKMSRYLGCSWIQAG
ncbi:Pentatricopeptide repeat-containing protein [Apostasia shenzhenica]|uniref:Pentatricopeptide repeat-containing protein n=1 Tax=Apostasia shenzhenica TaxID=1088818 RepID=A0A2I0B4C6_9ASPA|nr:Pentatricopeptide repeat-containing protein [Apostasia shenzhenica]